MFHVTALLDHYGYIILFASLLLELIALPIPTKVLMMYSGFLAFQGKLNLLFAILCAWLGSSSGITIAYWIGGRLGYPFFHKYGHRVHMGPEQLEKISKWFEKYGNKLLFIAFFIPGVRHITGYFSGITKIPYHTFASRAYIGALLWVFTFITLGNVLGPNWETFHTKVTKYLIIAGVVIAIFLILFYVYRKYKQRIITRVINTLNQAVSTFHSLGRVRFLVSVFGVVFVVLFSVMIGLIQDLLAHEFSDFDTIATMLIQLIFPAHGWMVWMQFLSFMQVLLAIAVVTLFFIFFKSKHKRLESSFLILVSIGGELIEEAIRWVFHRVGPSGYITRSFPSEQSFMAVAIYGFCAYLLYRHTKRIWARGLAFFAFLMVVLFNGISQVALGFHYPSDVIAGFVFAGVWISATVILLEVNRILPKTKK